MRKVGWARYELAGCCWLSPRWYVDADGNDDEMSAPSSSFPSASRVRGMSEGKADTAFLGQTPSSGLELVGALHGSCVMTRNTVWMSATGVRCRQRPVESSRGM